MADVVANRSALFQSQVAKIQRLEISHKITFLPGFSKSWTMTQMPAWPSPRVYAKAMTRVWKCMSIGTQEVWLMLIFLFAPVFAWAAPIKGPLSGSKRTGSSGRSANKRCMQVCIHLFLTRMMFMYGYDVKFFSSLPYFHSCRPLVKHDCRMMSACHDLRPLLPKTRRVDETDSLSGWEHFTLLMQWRRLITARFRQTGDSFLYLPLTSTFFILNWFYFGKIYV